MKCISSAEVQKPRDAVQYFLSLFRSVFEKTYSRCHEFPPSRLVLSASLRSRQSKIHRLQVGLHGSQPGLLWTTNPPSPVVRWARNTGLESSVMILSGVVAVETSHMKDRRRLRTVSDRNGCLVPSAGTYLIIGDKFRPMYVQDTSKAPIIQCIDRS